VTSKERHKRCCRKFKWASSTARCHHILIGLKSGKNGHLTCTFLHGHLQATRLYCKVSSHTNWVKIWQKRASDVHIFTWSPASISTVIRIPFRAKAAAGGGKQTFHVQYTFIKSFKAPKIINKTPNRTATARAFPNLLQSTTEERKYRRVITDH